MNESTQAANMNIMRTRYSPDQYAPKQRITGGIVLFLIMMLLYYLLKALLGISSTGADVARIAPLPDEMPAGTVTTPVDAPQSTLPGYVTINHFVFLGLDGKPLHGNTDSPELVEDLAENSAATPNQGGKWYVQVASFRERDRAELMAKKIKKDAKLDSMIVEVLVRDRTWYAVRLLPAPTRKDAEQQQRQLEQANIRRTEVRATP